jgi:heat-inducible transcriptional repressor
VFDLPAGLEAGALAQASNYLNHHIVGRTLAEAREHFESQRAVQEAELDTLTANLVEAGLATLSVGGGPSPTLIVRGRGNLIDDAMAFEDLDRVRQLFDELESKRGLLDLLSQTENAEGVRIFIGSENKLFSLSGSSVILSPFRDAGENVVGAVGVIGPTRLNYSRIVPVVDFTANVVSELVGRRHRR